MKQLLSKEVLYEPMKEIQELYPKWLDEKKGKLASEEYEKYASQYAQINELCQLYETDADFEKVVESIQKVQEYGHPPQEIVKKIAPGLQLGEDGSPVLVKY